MKNKHSGFTLLELLLVIAIIGVLASLAVASYQSHLQSSKRQVAVTRLLLAQQLMEREFLRTSSYPIALSTAQLNGLFRDGQHTSSSHQIAVVHSTATTYVLSATPAQTDELCGVLTINQSGQRTVSGTGTVADCW